MENNPTFLGTGWAFPPAFAANGAVVEMVSAEEDISQSLQILMSTALGERVMFADFGCDLERFLFEEVDQSLLNRMQHMVEDAIINYETRIELENFNIDATRAAEGVLLIELDYMIRTTNTRYNLVYPFYLFESNN